MIEYIQIKGYKSIKHLQLVLKPINILIGSNGSGKSNFISFFKLLNALFNQRLQTFIKEEKADNILYFGRRTTKQLYGKLIFTSDAGITNNAYYFNLTQDKIGGLYIDKESSGFNVLKDNDNRNYFDNHDLDESKTATTNYPRDKYLKEYMSSLRIFHFHDTSATSMLRKECDVQDNLYLKYDGRNLAAFLYFIKIKHEKIYARIVATVKSIAPYIDKFILEPSELNKKEIELRWVDKGDPESNFSAYQLSDGTIRFIGLATVLLQPNPPSVIIIDEPELGLHPLAIVKLAGMVQIASQNTQVIISTQSANLIDYFEPEDIITVDKNKEDNQSVFVRLEAENLKLWSDDYTLGDLWQRNIINSAQPFFQ
jgi:predicted ATPase